MWKSILIWKEKLILPQSLKSIWREPSVKRKKNSQNVDFSLWGIRATNTDILFISHFFPQVVAHCDMYAKRGGNNCCNNVGLRTNKKINIKAFCLRKWNFLVIIIYNTHIIEWENHIAFHFGNSSIVDK